MLLKIFFAWLLTVVLACSAVTVLVFRSAYSDDSTENRLNAAKQLTTVDIEMAENAELSVYNGGLLGNGVNGSETKDYLPKAYADFFYASLVEEYGYFGMSFFALFYIPVLICLLVVAMISRKEGFRDIMRSVNLAHVLAVIFTVAPFCLLVPNRFLEMFQHKLLLIYTGFYAGFAVLAWWLIFRKERRINKQLTSFS